MTPAVAEAIIESVREGNYLEPSAEAAGVSRKTVYEWVSRGEGTDDRSADPVYVDFAQRYRQAQAEAEQKMVRALSAAAVEDWRAAEAWLKRARPERWTERQQVQHDVGPSLADLLSESPLARTHSALPEPEGWEGTDG